ncbi:MAG: sigma-70 family RNA polymerase sigma factor [bacterium]|nr:sigma-70 family RNA polymerase sigma factor [bacterium]
MEERDFEEFYRRIQPALFRFGMRQLDAESASDAAIETLRTIWNKDLPPPRSPGEEAKLHGLAFKIMRGLITNHRRGEARRNRMLQSLTTLLHVGGGSEPDVADVFEDDRNELLSSLPPSEREVVLLVADGYRVHEIAAILDCSPNAVSMRLMRARARLRSILESDDSGKGAG